MIPKKNQIYSYVAVLGISGLLYGWTIAGNSQTAPIFAVKFSWDGETAKFYNTMITISSLVGLVAGTALSNLILKKGRRQAIIRLDIAIIIGQAIC